MTRTRATTAIAALCALAGCGGSSGDLISIQARGGPANRDQRIVVQDNGQASCNKGPASDVGSEALIDARELERDLKKPAENAEVHEGTDPRATSYVAQTKDGTVRWSESAPGLPPVLPRAQLFVLQQGRKLCGPG